jgi:hypothetical protein
MSAPGYAIIRPCPGIESSIHITDDSKLLPIGDIQRIKAIISQIYSSTQWTEEYSSTGKGWRGTASSGDIALSISFSTEKMYVGEIDIKWINIEVLSPQDLTQEIKKIAKALNSVALDMQTMEFL